MGYVRSRWRLIGSNPAAAIGDLVHAGLEPWGLQRHLCAQP